MTAATDLIARAYSASGAVDVDTANAGLGRGRYDRDCDEHSRFIFDDGSALWSSWAGGDLQLDDEFLMGRSFHVDDSRGHFGCVEHYRGLFDIDAGEYLGRATAAQIAASDSAGETGAILIDTETGEVLRSDYCRVTYPDVACVYVD